MVLALRTAPVQVFISMTKTRAHKIMDRNPMVLFLFPLSFFLLF